MKNTLSVAAFVATLAASFLLGRCSHSRPPVAPPEVVVDTLTIRDTIMAERPVYLTKRVTDTVAVPVRDTVTLRDTLFVLLQREQIEWRDSLATVWASGIEVAVDSVQHYTATQYITKEIRVPVKVRTRWGVGVSAGYGASKDGLTPYVGIGVTYNLLSW